MRFNSFSRSLLVLLCFAFSYNFLSAQYNYVGSVDHTNGEFVHDAEKGPDGGMLLLIQNSPISSLLTSLDSMGNLIWAKSISGVYEELMVASDGSIFLMEPDTANVNLAKLNSVGDSIWQQRYQFFFDDANEFFADLSPDGDVILGGSYDNFFTGLENIIMMVDASTGVPIWTKRRTSDQLSGIRATQDGGCLLLFQEFGFSATPGGEINRLDSLGNLVWAKELSGVNGNLEDLVETSNGDLVIRIDTLGQGPNGRSPVFLIRMDSAANFLFGVEVVDSILSTSSVSGIRFNSLAATFDNGAVFGGLKQGGDIFVLYTPLVFYLGSDFSSSYMLECFDPEFPPLMTPLTTAVTGIGEAGSKDFAYIPNTKEIFDSSSEVYFLKKQSVQDSSCGDCIKTFAPHLGSSLVTTIPQYTSITPTTSPLPLQTTVAVENVTSLCLECIEPISGGFFTQGSTGIVSFTSTLVNADSLVWDFGDGNTSTATNPTHGYSTPGTYTACLTGYGLCDTLDTCQIVSVMVGLENAWGKQIQVYPVPADQSLMVKGQFPAGARLRLMDLRGKVMFQQKLLNESQQESINVTALANGIYWLEISQDGQRFVKQVEVLR